MPPPAGASRSPLSTQRMASACSSVRAERLAMVRLRMRLPSRMLSRSRMAGLEPRLGTRSMYMPQQIADLPNVDLSHTVAFTWAHSGSANRRRGAYVIEMQGLLAISRRRNARNFGLDVSLEIVTLRKNSLMGKFRLRLHLLSLATHLTAALRGRAYQRCAPSNV